MTRLIINTRPVTRGNNRSFEVLICLALLTHGLGRLRTGSGSNMGLSRTHIREEIASGVLPSWPQRFEVLQKTDVLSADLFRPLCGAVTNNALPTRGKVQTIPVDISDISRSTSHVEALPVKSATRSPVDRVGRPGPGGGGWPGPKRLRTAPFRAVIAKKWKRMSSTPVN